MFERAREQASLMNEYFLAAVTAWIWAGDEAARTAALTAAVTAEKRQRMSLVQALQKLMEAGVFDAIGNESLGELISDIMVKDWGMWDVVKAKRALSKIDREYYNAMVPVDPDVFKRRHPDIPYER